jgi:outer membrane protein assembly factor BamB
MKGRTKKMSAYHWPKISLSLIVITLVLALFSGLTTKADTKPEKDGMYLQNLMHSGIKNTKGVEQLQGVKWKFKTSGKIYASPVIVDGIAYIGSEDKNLYAVNITTGNEVWKFATGGAVNSTPTIYNNTAFFASADGYFYAVDIKAGTLKWKFKTEGEKKRDIWDYYLSSPAVVNPYVYFGSGDGHM